MRILVTGGNGFIGSHLTELLLKQQHSVTIVDDLSTGQKSNLDHLLSHPQLKVVHADLGNPELIGEVCAEVDVVYHLAAAVGVALIAKHPIQTIHRNIYPTQLLLEEIRRIHLAGRPISLFLASTSEVYGDPQVHPQPESYWGNVNPIGIRSCYDEGKRVAETLFMDYARMNKVDIRIVRIFNTYGPRMHPFDGRVVSNFIRQCLKNEPITLFGNGQQTRSFCYRDDLVDAIIRMMNTEGVTGPINIGNPDEFTIRDLADITLELTASKSQIVHMPLPADDPTRRQPDITLARKHLGWNPSTSLREGLGKTIAWFRSIDIDSYRPPTPNYQ